MTANGKNNSNMQHNPLSALVAKNKVVFTALLLLSLTLPNTIFATAEIAHLQEKLTACEEQVKEELNASNRAIYAQDIFDLESERLDFLFKMSDKLVALQDKTIAAKIKKNTGYSYIFCSNVAGKENLRGVLPNKPLEHYDKIDLRLKKIIHDKALPWEEKLLAMYCWHKQFLPADQITEINTSELATINQLIVDTERKIGQIIKEDKRVTPDTITSIITLELERLGLLFAGAQLETKIRKIAPMQAVSSYYFQMNSGHAAFIYGFLNKYRSQVDTYHLNQDKHIALAAQLQDYQNTKQLYKAIIALQDSPFETQTLVMLEWYERFLKPKKSQKPLTQPSLFWSNNSPSETPIRDELYSKGGRDDSSKKQIKEMEARLISMETQIKEHEKFIKKIIKSGKMFEVLNKTIGRLTLLARASNIKAEITIAKNNAPNTTGSIVRAYYGEKNTKEHIAPLYRYLSGVKQLSPKDQERANQLADELTDYRDYRTRVKAIKKIPSETWNMQRLILLKFYDKFRTTNEASGTFVAKDQNPKHINMTEGVNESGPYAPSLSKNTWPNKWLVSSIGLMFGTLLLCWYFAEQLKLTLSSFLNKSIFSNNKH